MKKFFDIKALKSSEVCDKYSKSVSYETLVIGAATTGRECGEALEIEGVITRRTSVRRGYLPEKCTHANEESLFASVTCFMKLPRRIQRMLLVIMIPTLAFLLSLNLSTAFADTCECSWDGTDGKTLTISNCPDGALSNSSCTGQKTANNVIIGAGVTSIGNWAFEGATGLKSITIPDLVTSIGERAFNGTSSLKSITIPDSVTSIGDRAFQGATGLTSITIPDSVTSIGDRAFQDASSLESITIPDSVTSIGNGAFYYATGLTSITIPEGVTSIGGDAFEGASSLESIIIPDDIKTADWAANVFQNLPANTNIVCQGDVNTCYEKLKKYIPKDKGGTCTNFCIKKEIQPALFDSCKSTNYFWDGSTCLREPDVTKRKCCTSCKDMGGWCNRIRYTPAEAAKVLTDDNNNSVTITFKK